MELMPKFILMLLNPLTLRYPNFALGAIVFYPLMAAIFIYYRFALKHKYRILKFIPVSLSSLGITAILVSDIAVGLLHGRSIGVYNADEWQMYLHLCIFVFIYSTYALIFFKTWSRVVNGIKAVYAK